MVIRYLFTGITAVMLSTACSRTVSTSFPLPARTDTSSSIPAITAKEPNSWKIASPLGTEQTYISISFTTIELTSTTDTIREILQSRSEFTLGLNTADRTTTFRGALHKFSVNSAGRVASSKQIEFPVEFTGTIAEGMLTLRLASQTQESSSIPNCSNPMLSLLGSIRRAVFVAPREVTREVIWADSVTTTICHGMIPITLTMVETFRPAGEISHRGAHSILIEHTAKTIFSGEGPQDQHRVSLTGTGISSGKLYLDPLSGLILETIDEERTTLTVHSSGRRQQFTQVVTDTTTRIQAGLP
ncbi:MAG: hypothetical protein H0T48_09875 [Gemmatimonadaceae bacterium]|nr:hypothetical protein [Gemmatimonadaceae bacterium]